MKPQGPALGDDVVPVPDPVTEEPPHDRFCDLVMTGGVASGVVYPWAVVELARAYRFKSIGGTSVGAMAAALTAAAEYGRRCGFRHAFEPLRHLPGDLAQDAGGGRTRLLALFQPAEAGQRLFDLFVDAVRVFGSETPATACSKWSWAGRLVWHFRWKIVWAGLLTTVAWALLNTAVLSYLVKHGHTHHGWSWLFALPPLLLISAAVAVVFALKRDIENGVIDNDLGLVRGIAMPDRNRHDDPGLVDWLHKGIQLSAGLKETDEPLTFRDLWRAPITPGAAHTTDTSRDARGARSINLEMVTTNVTHGRPYRLPLDDESSHLYFVASELECFFPARVMQALMRVAQPYRPASPSDPIGPPLGDPLWPKYFKLPEADLPIVIAARLSLSFPILFSAVPLYAVDYEIPRGPQRCLKRCRFSDGGLSSNFPIHLFDAAAPRHPTFGLWLDKRTAHPERAQQALWLPQHHQHGRGDNWQRFEPQDPMAQQQNQSRPGLWGMLGGYLLATALSAKDWGDRSNMRMPHVRNRVARLYLQVGEGELNIAMPRQTILNMAATYGTAAGLKFVERFVAPNTADSSKAWNEHQWVRLHILLASLREMLTGLTRASENTAHSTALLELIERSTQERPLKAPDPRPGTSADPDPGGQPLSESQKQALLTMLNAARALEKTLQSCAEDNPLPYQGIPTPSLRVRPPL